MYNNNKQLIILDVDGTIVDAYSAIDKTFSRHGMILGNEENFQKRRRLFKYLGGLREFPLNLKKQLGRQNRKKLIATLTQVYREEARLYPDMAELIQTLIAAPEVVVGVVTRNVSNEPKETLRQLFQRHGIDMDGFDFFAHVPPHQEKTTQFRSTRAHFGINPALGYICGDEFKDFLAANGSGMHPFMVSYGFEDHKRLTEKFLIPEEVISRTPAELSQRVLHALGIAPSENT